MPQLGQGAWRLIVHRDGASAAGFVQLAKSFEVRVTAAPVPTPPPAPPQPRPVLVPPMITAAVEPSATGVMIRVTGTGFLPNRPPNAVGIVIRVADTVQFQDAGGSFTRSDGTGAINALIGPVLVGHLRRNALDQAAVAVAATDSRDDRPACRPTSRCGATR